MAHRYVRVLTLCAFLSTLGTNLFGQAISGDLTGSVLDATGSAIPLAALEAVNDETGVKTSATSDSRGGYRLSNLPVGTYTVTVTAKGFSVASVKNIKITLSSTITQNFIMQVGGTS